ncbi:winged helix-turn-helix transcriptional regulator [Chitinophaga nivalis]|uniref:Helix-turn-helix transcriptional regulator n=1 Tax=Chitinophaga nivalis TaxID=2991709 RepID=A0ABT3ILV7_9BACT|nr:helix-turn-helix domain-containing protein [Chitinophaga nivalis]MCW3465357.1 helix-turn-helix transcriptional regulator [Chitinophaga nivalis]MCW3484951.1 helix-turn-helix transcriptional regulator [Chitinophaga nivalis]
MELTATSNARSICRETSHTDCQKVIMPVRDALDVISGKWKLPIIIAVSSGHKRFRDIERSIPRITSKVLSKELKDLETHKLVKRTVYDSQPVSVEYTLTPYADTLNSVIDALHRWGLQHRKKILGR